MPVDRSIPDTIIDVLGQIQDKRPTEAVVYGIDGDRADIRLENSVSIVRHVEVIGNVDTINVGDTVQISWRSDGRPVVMLIGSGGSVSSSGGVVPDNVTIENSNFGLRVKKGGISREHLSFILPDEVEVADSLTRAGWTVDQYTGIISNTGIRILPAGEISLGDGNDIIKLSAYGTADNPADPQDDTEYRLWVGNILPFAAPFAVTKSGDLIAKSGLIGGWDITDDGLVSDAGNAVIHSGARPYIGLGAAEYLDDGFWAGLDTDYIYKVSIGSAAAGRLAYDGTSLTLDNLDFNMYYGTLWTLEIQADGDFSIGSDIDTTAGTSMKIFTNAQSWDSESFGAGDIMIGDHGGAHMAWVQNEGQLQFRDGSTTGAPVRAYMDTDGSIMFGTGQGRLDDTGISLDASINRSEEYYWNSINWLSNLGETGETLAGRISGADKEVWIHVPAVDGRVSIGTDAEGGGTAWSMVYGVDGGEFWFWNHNETLDGVNTWGDVQYWVNTSPPSSAPQAGFGHRTMWYLQDGAHSLNYVAAMDVVWVEGWGGGEPGSAMKFFVYPDASLTEMFRIGSMDGITVEDPYAAVVNPQEHSEGNFLVMGAQARRLIETDSGTGEVFLGGLRTYIKYGSAVDLDTGAGHGILYAWESTGKLYWRDDEDNVYDLTGSGGLWSQGSGYIYRSGPVAIGSGSQVPYTYTKLLITDSSAPETGYTPWNDNYSDIVVQDIDGTVGMIFVTPDGPGAAVIISADFVSTGTNDQGYIGIFGPSHSVYPRGISFYNSGYSVILDPLYGRFTASVIQFDSETTHNPNMGDNDFIFYGDQAEVARIDAGNNRFISRREIQISEWNSPGPPGTNAGFGFLYNYTLDDGNLYWWNDNGIHYKLSNFTYNVGTDRITQGNANDYLRLYNWLELEELDTSELPDTNEPASGWGAVYVKASDGKLYFMNDSAVEYDLTQTGSEWTESGGFLTQGTSTDIVQVQNWIELEELTTATLPVTGEPGTGWGAVYAKASDGKLYFKNEGGTEYDLTVQGGPSEWTESGGFLTQATSTDIVQVQSWIELEELTTGNLPTTGEPDTGWGAIYVKATDGKVYFKNDGGTEYDLTVQGGAGEWNEAGGFLTQATSTDIIQVQNWLELEELTTANLPVTGEPGSGWGAIYVKALDGDLYYRDDAGAETNLLSGGTGGGASILEVQVFS